MSKEAKEPKVLFHGDIGPMLRRASKVEKELKQKIAELEAIILEMRCEQATTKPVGTYEEHLKDCEAISKKYEDLHTRTDRLFPFAWKGVNYELRWYMGHDYDGEWGRHLYLSYEDENKIFQTIHIDGRIVPDPLKPICEAAEARFQAWVDGQATYPETLQDMLGSLPFFSELTEPVVDQNIDQGVDIAQNPS